VLRYPHTVRPASDRREPQCRTTACSA